VRQGGASGTLHGNGQAPPPPSRSAGKSGVGNTAATAASSGSLADPKYLFAEYLKKTEARREAKARAAAELGASSSRSAENDALEFPGNSVFNDDFTSARSDPEVGQAAAYATKSGEGGGVCGGGRASTAPLSSARTGGNASSLSRSAGGGGASAAKVAQTTAPTKAKTKGNNIRQEMESENPFVTNATAQSTTPQRLFLNFDQAPGLLHQILLLQGGQPPTEGSMMLDPLNPASLNRDNIKKAKEKLVGTVHRLQADLVLRMLKDGAERTVFLAGSGPDASAWLKAIPVSSRQKWRMDAPKAIDNDEFVDACRERLNADRLQRPAPVTSYCWDCPGCGQKGVMNPKGHHVGQCSSMAGLRTARHDDISRTLVAFLNSLNKMRGSVGHVQGETHFRTAGFSVQQPESSINSKQDKRNRIDVFYQEQAGFPPNPETSIYVDFTVTSGFSRLNDKPETFKAKMAETIYNEKGHIVSGGGRPQGEAVLAGQKKKRDKYTRVLPKDQANLVTCAAIEAHGLLSPEAKGLILTVAHKTARAAGQKKNDVLLDIVARKGSSGGSDEQEDHEEVPILGTDSGTGEGVPEAEEANGDEADHGSSSSSSTSLSSAAPNPSFSSSSSHPSNARKPNLSQGAAATTGATTTKKKSQSNNRSNGRLVRQMTINRIYRNIVETVMMNLRRGHARVFTQFFRQNRLVGGNKWVTTTAMPIKGNEGSDPDDSAWEEE